MIFFWGGGSLHHCSISVAVSHGDAAGQDALNHAAVEVAEDLRWQTISPCTESTAVTNLGKLGPGSQCLGASLRGWGAGRG